MSSNSNRPSRLTRKDAKVGGYLEVGTIATPNADGPYFKLPTMTTAQRTTLTAAEGMQVYDTTLGKEMTYRSGGWGASDGTAAGSLDAAYNGGGAITVDASHVTFNLADASNDYAVVIDSTDSSGTLNDMLLLQTTGAATVTDAIDVSDAGITNAINVGANTILGTTAVINFTNFDVDASGNTTIAGTGTITGAATLSSTLALADTLTTQGAIIIDIDAAEAFLVRENADAADILTIDTTNDAGDTTFSLNSKTTTGKGVYVDLDTTTGAGLHIDGQAITTGDGVRISIDSTAMTAAGAALSVVDENSSTEVFAIRDDGTVYSKGTAEGTDVITIDTGDITVTDGDITISGGELAITDGVTTTGAGITLTSSVTTAVGFDLSAASLTTGKALDISNLDAITTGKAIHVDATGITQTSGILVHIDSATTGLTGAGRLLLVDATADFDAAASIAAEFKSVHTTGIGVQFTQDAVTDGSGVLLTADALTTGAGISLNTSSTALTTAGNLLYVGASGDFNDAGGQVVEIESVHTTGTGVQLTMDSITDGYGIAGTFDALTSGIAVDIVSSSTGLTTAGNLLHVHASGDFNDAGGQVVEIQSAHTTGTGLQLTMDAVTDGYGAFMTADALTSGQGVSLNTSSTALTTAGNLLYVGASGDFDDAGGQVVEIESAHTTGTGVQLTMDAVTDGYGVFMTADALTTGLGVALTSSATAITGAGRIFSSAHTGTTGTTAVLNEFSSAATDETTILKVTASAALAAGTGVLISGASIATGTALKIDTINTTGSAIHIDNASGVQSDNTGLVFIDHGGNMAAGSNIIRIAPTGTPVETSVGIEIVGGSKVMQGLVIDSDAATSSANVFTGDGIRSADTAVVEFVANVAASNADSQVVRIEQASATGANVPLGVLQADVSEPLVLFESTEGSGNSVDETQTTEGSLTGFLRISVNGTDGYLSYYGAPSA
jgi:hypothetical protein